MPYTSNSTLPELAAWLGAKRRIVILTHVKPDGDAIGSTLALARALNQPSFGNAAGPRAEIWYFGPQPHWYAALALEPGGRSTPARVGEHSAFPPPPIQLQDLAPSTPDRSSEPSSEPDAIVITDTGSWQQLEPAAAWLKPRRDRTAIIDHHVQGDPDVADRRVIDPSAAAVCQLVAELARLLLRNDRLSQLPVPIAEPAYLGIMTDTGWFKHSNVSPAAMRAAADLIEAGVDHSALYQRIEQTDRPARLRLLSRALGSLRLDAHGTIASMLLTKRDFTECDAGQGDAGGFADFGQSLESTRVTAMLTESDPLPDGRPVTKVSLRSKNSPDSPDVNQAAKLFGGGGHVRAAGARINAPIAEAREMVVKALTEQRPR